MASVPTDGRVDGARPSHSDWPIECSAPKMDKSAHQPAKSPETPTPDKMPTAKTAHDATAPAKIARDLCDHTLATPYPTKNATAPATIFMPTTVSPVIASFQTDFSRFRRRIFLALHRSRGASRIVSVGHHKSRATLCPPLASWGLTGIGRRHRPRPSCGHTHAVLRSSPSGGACSSYEEVHGGRCGPLRLAIWLAPFVN
jgi:hypothetical protein